MLAAELDQVVAELKRAASYALGANGLLVSRGGAPFKVGHQMLMFDLCRVLGRYGIPTTGWRHESGLESPLYSVYRLVARIAGLDPAADPRQILEQAENSSTRC